MPTTVTKSIGSAAGRDFATISAWVAYVNGRGDITAAGVDEIHRGQCYKDSVFTEVTLLENLTVTRDAAHPVTLEAAPGQGFGLGANALSYDESKGVAIRLNGTTATGIIVAAANVIFDGLQIKLTGAYTNSVFPRTLGLIGAVLNCVIDTGTASTVVNTAWIATGPGILRNCAIFHSRPSAWLASAATTAAVMEGCSFYNTSGTARTQIQANTNGRVTVKNCFFFGCAGVDLWSTGLASGPTGTTNATDGNLNYGTGVGGLTPANEVVSATSPYDLRLKSTSTIKTAGTASATNPTDVFGTTRSNPPSIGAFEYIAAAAGVSRFAGIPLGVLNQ